MLAEIRPHLRPDRLRYRDCMNFKNLSNVAKKAVDKRGGTESLKQDFGELQRIAKGKGTPAEKAKKAAAALKTPGAAEGRKAADTPPADGPPPAA
ncbi:MAG: hypothetical protein JWO02_903 [Solirubrobacterales bacterium]|nr:hypothetical protein [Solirubrobacterales bacterium]